MCIYVYIYIYVYIVIYLFSYMYMYVYMCVWEAFPFMERLPKYGKASHSWEVFAYCMLGTHRHSSLLGFVPASASPISGPYFRPPCRTSVHSPSASLTTTAMFERQRARSWASTARPWGEGSATMRVHIAGDHAEISVLCGNVIIMRKFQVM